MTAPDRSPFQIRNVRLFILFRVLFNARFYYPVFSILFLDFGLGLAQFALLNAVWAATIVLCEVPSGALADTIGRRNLLVFAGILMVLEITLWAFVPRGNLTLLFWALVLNRILSGMAEAAASGADEALAYDSLQQEGDLSEWGRVLERQIQFQSLGFVLAMTLGGVVYDPQLLQWGADRLGLDMVLTRATTLRLPLYLTLATAIGVLLTTLSMREIRPATGTRQPAGAQLFQGSFRMVWNAGRWILRTPFVLGIILFGLLYDSVIRMLITMASEYYRVVEVPEALLGILGSVVALFGFVVPGLARRLTQRYSALFNLLVTALLILLGLVGMAQAWPTVGVFPALLLFSNMFMINFFLSYYLNRATSSEQRATVLSFKGLFLNLGYGAIGILYSLLLVWLRGQTPAGDPSVSPTALKNLLFIDSLPWFSWYFLSLLLVLLLGFARPLRRMS